MAKDNQSFNKKPTVISKGLHNDVNQEFQIENTYNFALNAMLISDTSDKISIINEEGNEACISINSSSDSPAVIGKCLLPNGNVVLFINYINKSVIAMQYHDCTYKELIISECLNFNSCKPIDCEAKIHNGCNTIIYFTDSYNKYRTINLDELDTYIKTGWIGNPNVPNINGEYGWDCSLFNFNPDFIIPKIQLKSVNRSGNLRIGTYYISLRYLDKSLNTFNWIPLVGPINITEPPFNQSRIVNNGGILSPSSDGYFYANKNFIINISELDLRYTYFQLAIIEYTQGTDTNNLTYLSKTYSIQSTIDVTIDELTPSNGFVTYDTQAVVVPNLYLDVVKAHCQVDNRLITANLINNVVDWSVFQKKALEIGVEYFTYKKLTTDLFNNCDSIQGIEISNRDSYLGFETTGNESPIFNYDFRTLMRDEIYALGIVYVFKNGKQSPVFHIPGRSLISELTGDRVTIDGQLYTEALGINQWGGVYDRFGTLSNDSYNCNFSLGVIGWDDYNYITANQPWSLVNNGSDNPIQLTDTVITNAQYIKDNCTTIKRWNFLNTSIRANKSYPFNAIPSATVYTTGDVNFEIYSSGAMGYFETGTPYPDSKNCDGERIFPEGNIRHHRLPDSRKEPLFQGNWVGSLDQLLFPIGLKFSNITVPSEYADQVQGYYIMRSDRAGNKTVIDKGWLNVCHDTNRGVRISQNHFWMSCFACCIPFPPVSSFLARGYNIAEFVSPKTQFGNVYLQGSHFKIENTIISTPVGDINGSFSGNTTDNNPDSSSDDGPKSFGLYGYCQGMTMKLPRTANLNGPSTHTLLHTLPLLDSEYGLYNQNDISRFDADAVILNDNHRQTALLCKLYNSESPSIIDYHRYRFAQPASVYGINDITHYLEQDLNTAIAGDISGGFLTSPFNTNYGVHFYYMAVKSDIIPYTKLEDIQYIKLNNNIIPFDSSNIVAKTAYITGGDCFIARMVLQKHYYKDTDTDKDNNSSSNINNAKASSTLLFGYTESEINSTYRHKDAGDTYYAYPFNTLNTVLKTTIEELHLGFREFIDVKNKYRLDFSADNKSRLFSALSDANDYCSECSENFPHTIRYSSQSLTNQIPDYYRLFEENDVLEITTDTGSISDLFVKNSSLMVHTTGSLFRFNLAPQELETNNDTVKVGSGNLLNAKPQKLFDNQQGFSRGGVEFKFSASYCDDSYIWVDSISKRIYALDNEISELSLLGMQRWFTRNLGLTLRDQFKSLSMINHKYDYPHLDITCEQGIGFMSSYDPKYKRFILTKKDYKLSQTLLNNILFDEYNGTPPIGLNPYILNQIYYNQNGIFQANTTSTLKVYQLDSTDDLLIENLSWTISYSLLDKAWVSWHSYRPNFIYNNNNSFFTYLVYPIHNQFIWKHNVKKNYQNYYGVKFDFILDYVQREDGYTNKTFDTIEYTSNVYEFNDVTENWVEKQFVTFDKFYSYNNNQLTGEKNLIINNPLPYFNYNYDVQNATINKYDNVWKIKQLFDYGTSRLDNLLNFSMFSNNFSDLSNYYQPGMGYIDKVINTNFIDLTQNVYQLSRMTDKYLSTRLFFKPENDYKIVFNMQANLSRERV